MRIDMEVTLIPTLRGLQYMIIYWCNDENMMQQLLTSLLWIRLEAG